MPRASPRSSRPPRSEHLGSHRVTVSILLCLAMMTAQCTNLDDSDVDPFQDIDDPGPSLSGRYDISLVD
eukprot:7849522-Pyramimonas_sp.AAC.1